MQTKNTYLPVTEIPNVLSTCTLHGPFLYSPLQLDFVDKKLKCQMSLLPFYALNMKHNTQGTSIVPHATFAVIPINTQEDIYIGSILKDSICKK